MTKRHVRLGLKSNLFRHTCFLAPFRIVGTFARDSKHWHSPTQLASSRRPRFGHRVPCRFLLYPRAKRAAHHECLRSNEHHRPLPAKELALCLTAADLRKVTWREGTRGPMRSRFPALRV